MRERNLLRKLYSVQTEAGKREEGAMDTCRSQRLRCEIVVVEENAPPPPHLFSHLKIIGFSPSSPRRLGKHRTLAAARQRQINDFNIQCPVSFSKGMRTICCFVVVKTKKSTELLQHKMYFRSAVCGAWRKKKYEIRQYFVLCSAKKTEVFFI